LVARTEDEVKKAAEEITNATGRIALGVAGDVTSSISIAQTVQKAIDTFGHIDILVNNAGTSVRKNIADLSEEDWDRIMDVNFKSVFLMCREVGRYMVQQG
jgi:NAD(P)-dependent dehydrogenase (short-subunit alcohol dehydrogenase family)